MEWDLPVSLICSVVTSESGRCPICRHLSISSFSVAAVTEETHPQFFQIEQYNAMIIYVHCSVCMMEANAKTFLYIIFHREIKSIISPPTPSHSFVIHFNDLHATFRAS